jgi:uncharacterized protein
MAPVKGNVKIIDCDVHVYPKHPNDIRKHLQQPWYHRFHMRQNLYYKHPNSMEKRAPSDSGHLGRDPDLLRKQLIDRFNMAYAILIPQFHVSANHDPDYTAQVARACNTWLYETWLQEYNDDGVFKGSIVISHQDPQLAAEEIEYWADYPHFVQVLMESGARAPFGQRHYYPIYEACQKKKLPIVIHPAGEAMGVNHPVWAGHPSYYVEYYTSFSLAMQSHLVSILTEGVFERFPHIKMVIAEGGVSWLPALMWRLDMEWKALRSEVPWLVKKPSEYLIDHIRFTTQPMERPKNDKDLLEVLDMMNAEHLLMFSSDYPHHERFSPEESLPSFSDEWEYKIKYDNAMRWYQLE